MSKTESPHPEWALSFKRPGTELRRIKDRYYLYSYKTVYDKDKRKPKKITGKLLGSITREGGFKASPKRQLEGKSMAPAPSRILCREYGVAKLVAEGFQDFNAQLARAFPEDWKNILAIAYCRFVYRCPLKSVPFRLESSYLLEALGLDPFGEKKAPGVLNRVGGQRESMLAYMRSFISEGDYMLMDATDISCNSKHIDLSRKGYSKNMQYEPQVNLMYIYSANSQMPVYYRVLPGNVRDVKAFKNCLVESGLHDAVVVADKGFYSKENVESLRAEGLRFVIPMKRDNKEINYSDIASNQFKQGESYFQHEKRPVWHRTYATGQGIPLYLFLDEELRTREEADYLKRTKTHPENYTIAEYHNKKHHFGTIALISEIGTGPEDVYKTYKSRGFIEVMFDGMKNVLNADHTYMQNEQTLQGWMFVNHITLQWYQKLYVDLKEKDLLKRISVNDIIQQLTDVRKIKIDGQWYLNEFTSQTQKMMKKLNISI